MILVFGTLADPVTAYLCARLCARDEPFVLLDARRYLRDFDLAWSLADGGVDGAIRAGARWVGLDALRSICVRWLDLPELPREAAETAEEHGARVYEAFQAIVAFADTVPVLVVSRPASFGSNSSKPYQQQLVARYGFAVPRTLVTTEPEEARRFYEECGRRVIYKSLSHRRSIVRRMTPEDLDRLHAIRHCPTQFQEYVPGVDIRVHTVGSEVFPTEIVTEATDYRYAGHDGASREMRAATLPPELAERCLRLADGAGLVMSGIDLRRSPAGEHYCFEINPTPGFTFYQRYTGQRIGEALVDLLCRGAL